MANAICVRTTLESETMRIPELLPFVGKRVQIIVVEEEPIAAENVTGAEALPKRTLGSLRGVLEVPDDFDGPLPEEVLRAFEGETGSGGCCSTRTYRDPFDRLLVAQAMLEDATLVTADHLLLAYGATLLLWASPR